jgi:twitching motility protein PilT
MTAETKVKELEFSDLYLGHPSLEDRFSDVPGANTNPLPASPVLRNDLAQLTGVCRETFKTTPSVTDFKVCYDGVTYRVSVMQSMAGHVFVLRKMASAILSLAELGIPQAYVRHLMTRDLSGLLVISGAIKAGKTMTACATVKDRLNAYGGVAVTGEDPIEVPLEGSYGPGICFQTTIRREERGFTEAFRQLTRCGARIILIDEIRDQETAAEVLQASINGHLIVTTMLAENVTRRSASCMRSPTASWRPAAPSRSWRTDWLVCCTRKSRAGPCRNSKPSSSFSRTRP